MNFDILDTGIRELWNPEDNTYTANRMRTFIDGRRPIEEEVNDNAFQVTLTFTLSEFDALNISHSVENKNNNIDNGESSSTSSNNNNVGESSSNLDFEYAAEVSRPRESGRFNRGSTASVLFRLRRLRVFRHDRHREKWRRSAG